MTDTFHALDDRLQRARTAAGALRQQLARLPDRHSLQTPPFKNGLGLSRSPEQHQPGLSPPPRLRSLLLPSPFKRASLLGARFLTLYAHVEVAAPLGFEPRPPSSKPGALPARRRGNAIGATCGIRTRATRFEGPGSSAARRTWRYGAGSENRTRVFCLEGSGSAIELRPRGGWCRDRTCATRRSRRISIALPYHSANHPM